MQVQNPFLELCKSLKKADPQLTIDALHSTFHSIYLMSVHEVVAAHQTMSTLRKLLPEDKEVGVVIAYLLSALSDRAQALVSVSSTQSERIRLERLVKAA